jgi:hypothetical protein
MLLFIPRSVCALKRVAAKSEHARFGATQGIRIILAPGLYRAEATDGRRAMIVQGLTPTEEPPWPGFKELPDDACEAVILPKDLERACKVGEDFLQSRFNMLGIATMGNDVCLGLGSDLVTARTVEGRFPNISQVVPKKRPLFTFSIDPKLFAETLLAMADLLPDESRVVHCFYYGEGLPVGFCARNPENGAMIDALIVPLVAPKPDPKAQEPQNKATEEKATEPQPEAAASEAPADDAPPPEANGQKPKKSRKAKE